ncbi:MAG: PQQ-dependent sugar dehydrogenase [Lacunisphaera sp.]
MQFSRVAALSAFSCAVLLASSFGRETSLPYVTEDAFNLNFDQPVGIVAPPGETNRLFVVEKTGRIMVIPDLNHPSRKTFLDLKRKVGDDEVEQGVLAIAFHPDYRHNRQFYVWYTSCLKVNGRIVREDRLSRFLVSAENPNVADPSSEQPLISQADEAPNHNGGELLFGPDGYLYLSLGDEGGGNDEYHNGQRVDRDFFSGILRLDVDLRPGSIAPNPHPAVHPGTYAIPADNPFVGATSFNGLPVDPRLVRTEFWAVGLRNPWRMSFDPATGRLWCGDVGQESHEEVDLIVRGGNYGWSFREGNFPFRGVPPPGAVFNGPVWDYPHTDGLCITGGLVSHGSRYPDLDGKYLFADFVTGHISALQPDGDQPVKAANVKQVAQGQAIASFARDPRNGDVLLASIWDGKILRLVRNSNAGK